MSKATKRTFARKPRTAPSADATAVAEAPEGSETLVTPTAAPHLSARNDPDGVVRSLLAAMPQAIAVDVVEVTTGLTSTGEGVPADPHRPMLATCNTAVVQEMLDIIAGLRMTDQTLDEILVTTSTQYHLIKLFDEARRFVYCAVRKRDTSLALAREVLRQHATS